MTQISLEAANLIYRYASITALVALTASAGAGLIIYVTSEIRGKYADESIALASAMGAQANESAAKANIKAELLTRENLQLSLILEKERKERIELERKLGPRTLNAEQVTVLRETLGKLPNDSKILIMRNEASKEILNYATEIKEIFKAAGATVSEAKNIPIILNSADSGVRLLLLGGPGREQIRKAMELANITSEIRQFEKPSKENEKNFAYDWSMSAVIDVKSKSPHL